jgi:hypothetical protein
MIPDQISLYKLEYSLFQTLRMETVPSRGSIVGRSRPISLGSFPLAGTDKPIIEED